MIKEKIYLSFDISTSKIGISLFNEDYSFKEVKLLSLDIDKDIQEQHRLLAKATVLETYLKMFECYEVLGIIIEDPLKGSNNQFTANMLMRFNGICSYMLYKEFMVLPEFITVYDWRKQLCPEFLKVNGKKITHSFPKDVDKKIYVLEKVAKLYPTLDWAYKKTGTHKDGNFDMADAIGIGLGYFIREKKIVLK